jgi:hypothetical protein
MPKAGGKWNNFEITAKGSQLIVVLNGVQTAKTNHGQFVQGPVGSNTAAARRVRQGAPSNGVKSKSNSYRDSFKGSNVQKFKRSRMDSRWKS